MGRHGTHVYGTPVTESGGLGSDHGLGVPPKRRQWISTPHVGHVPKGRVMLIVFEKKIIDW